MRPGLGEELEAISVIQIRDNKGPTSGGGGESKEVRGQPFHWQGLPPGTYG